MLFHQNAKDNPFLIHIFTAIQEDSPPLFKFLSFKIAFNFIEEMLGHFASSVRANATYLWRDYSRSPKTVKIGVMAIFIVVSFLSLLVSLLDISPVFFVQLAEVQVFLIFSEPNKRDYLYLWRSRLAMLIS